MFKIFNVNLFRRIQLHIPETGKLIRSFYFCFRYLPFNQAIKMPIFLHIPVRVCKLKKGNIIFDGEIESRQVEFVEGVAGFPALDSNIYIEEDSKLIFKGKTFISKGCTLRVDNGGVLEIGRNFVINKNTIIRCSKRIIFGDDVMIGWNNEINDNDGHPIFIEGKKLQTTSEIVIGSHVWITSHVLIGKGVIIPQGCIVAKGAVVTKKHQSAHTLIAGVPANEIKKEVNWSVN